MKIAFFTDTYHPELNGVTVSLDNFAQELRNKGHEVVFFAPKVKGYRKKDKNTFRISSIKIVDSEPKVRFPLPVFGDALKEIAKEEFDIVHAHGNGAFSFLGYQVARMKGVPYILTFHTLHTKYAHYFLKGKVITPRMIATGMRVFANICDGIIVPSKKMQLELQSYGVNKEIHIIPNFVRTEKYEGVNTDYLRNFLGLPQDALIVLSVGRLGIEKNFNFILNAFKNVASQNSNTHLVIIGKGPERQNLLEQAISLNISDRVHFIEYLEQDIMPQAYRGSDIFVFASETETQGLCVLEAAVSGLPLVLSDDLAYDNIVEDNVNGFILPLKVELFTNAITRLVDNIQLRKDMGEESKRISKNNFDGKKITDELIAIYLDILSNKKTSRKIIKRVNKVAIARIIQWKRNLDRILN